MWVCPIPLLDADTLDADPLDADPSDAEPPGSRPPPSYVTCDACWEANPPPLWTEGLTDACENITLLQTSFAGSKHYKIVSLRVLIIHC